MLNNSQQRLAAIQLALLLQMTQRIIRLQQLVALFSTLNLVFSRVFSVSCIRFSGPWHQEHPSTPRRWLESRILKVALSCSARSIESKQMTFQSRYLVQALIWLNNVEYPYIKLHQQLSCVAQTKRDLPEASLTRPAWINWASKQSCAADICYTVHKALRCLNKAAMRALPKINTHWHPETLIKMNLGELKVSNVALLWNSSGIAVDCMSATKAVLQDSLTCIPRYNFVTKCNK